MAYNNAEEKELLRLEKNARGDYLVIKEVGESVDIRQYYTSDADEVLPTKKGVRFNKELIPDVIEALINGYGDELPPELIELITDEE